ncbi:hypothetical protein BCR39DRAFT_538349 [Naematelia encephala]|uniref:Secreted protein n=1 Tax=Naematelia encephala TaxID=71784 RepID=A0A1Y2AXK5_9TREE|nr:hypothetical protein BCR39DRAFT_538349 [Naematelia encephala]
MKFSSTVVLFATLFGMVTTVKGQLIPPSAQFYTDTGCTVANGGLHPIISNECFSQAGSGSVKVPDTGLGHDIFHFNLFALYTSDPSGDEPCSTLNEPPITFYADGSCIVLNNTDNESYQFAGPCGLGLCP